MSIPNITQDIELPVGIEHDGTFYKKVTMRKVKNSDIMAVQQDVEVRSLGGKNLQIRDKDPVKAMEVNAALIQVFVILFSRTIIAIDGFTKEVNAQVLKPLLKELFQEDMEALMNVYSDLNGIDLKKGSSDPLLEQLGISSGDSHTQ